MIRIKNLYTFIFVYAIGLLVKIRRRKKISLYWGRMCHYLCDFETIEYIKLFDLFVRNDKLLLTKNDSERKWIKQLFKTIHN